MFRVCWALHLHLGNLADTSIKSDLQRFIHTSTVGSTIQGDKGHLDTQLRGAGDRISNLPVSSQLFVPAELS